MSGSAHRFWYSALCLMTCLAALPQQTSRWELISPKGLLDGAAVSAQALERIVPAGKRSVWITSGRGAGLVSNDGGRSWKLIKAFPARSEIHSLNFLDDRNGWAVGSLSGKAFLAFTTDGGNSWDVARMVAEANNGVLADVRFFDRKFGIAVGGGEGEGAGRSIIAITQDGGANWNIRLLPTEDPQAVLRRVWIQSQSAIWAIGGKSIYASLDGGASWHLKHTEPDAIDLTGLAVVEGAGIFVTGGFGLVARSRDKGATWEKLKVPAAVDKQYFYSLSFADASQGWACGEHGAIIATQDGGETWLQEANRQSELLRDITVIGHRVLSVGDSLTIVQRPL